MSESNNGAVASAARSPHLLRLGFVPQLESAPLLVAHERGFFAAAGLNVRVARHACWSTVRDGLVYGTLDAAQGLAGFGVISQLGRELFSEPLVSLMTLGLGGAAIVLSQSLVEDGVTSGPELARWLMMNRTGGAPVFAHNFCCSPQRYVLREWLAASGINPDRDVRLTTVMPPLVVEQLQRGYLSGFCTSEPMGTLAEHEMAGRIVARGCDVLPDHPNQALVVSRRWLERHGEIAGALVRATLQAAAWCEDPAHRRELSRMLARSEYLNAPVETLEACLASGHRRISPASLFPSKMHAVWMLQQMIRWSEMSAEADVAGISDRCCDAGPFRTAAASLGIAVPADDFPPMPLANGQVLSRAQLAPPQTQRAVV